MLPETVVRLATIPSIVGIKEASGSLDQASQIVHEAPTGFVVLSGDDSLTLPIMGVGGTGIISVVSNIVPDAVSALTNACLAGDFATGRAMHLALFDLCRAMFVETNPVPVKAAAALLGYCTPEVRLPLAPLSESAQRRVETALEAWRAEPIMLRQWPLDGAGGARWLRPRRHTLTSNRTRHPVADTTRHVAQSAATRRDRGDPLAEPGGVAMTTRIGIAGLRGRMGREIATLAASDPDVVLVGRRRPS